MVTFFEIWVSLKYLLPKTKEKFFSKEKSIFEYDQDQITSKGPTR